MRVVFLGSPQFAVPSLRALLRAYPVVGVVTQPDRPAGRGLALRPPAVKQVAQEVGLPVIQPRRLDEAEAMQTLREWAPDLIVVAAFGQILRPEVLTLPAHGCLNVHASLLPRWRGAAPVQAAILHGDAETGVTLMKMDAGLDTGPILAQRSLPIREDDTGGSLAERLSHAGAELLLETLPDYLAGRLQPRPQDNSQATYAPRLHKADGALDFSQAATRLERQVRAYDPWPGCYFLWQDRRVNVLKARAESDPAPDPGKVVERGGEPAIATSDGFLVLITVQPAGRGPMSGSEFARGARGFVGARLTPASPASHLNPE